MKAVLVILAVLALVLLVGGLHRLVRNRRRAEVRAVALGEEERSMLCECVPLYARMPEETRRKLDGLTQVFLHEVGFEPCGHLREVTPEMQLIIGAQASVLLLGSGYHHFGKLRSVLIYPNAYEAGDDLGEESIRLGESWDSGSVVLSWESVRQGAMNPEDGLNVVLHEFAHQLDQFDGVADGLPVLKSRDDYPEWAEVMQASFKELCEMVERGKRTVLDDYGATNPAEFFAVSTETFFERPSALYREHPELFGQLKRFYGLDPLDWA